ncbi:MAG: putative hydroxymethylpyrimidine transport system substrate-binding protein [Solirubrobacteraceae bacterium]|nr:putative hydroxymethylpyrimidine transport system substrate-binding protein [Solirubrobacteraceae bacterium]MEA2394866.1 putative hydroxymethylpyrimidine transport system substrate-binding protein [Solirubrobacteraceae bacterium]
MALRRLKVLALCLLALGAAGCSTGSDDQPERPATLVLDFQPNAVHVGIYLALERDYPGANGVRLHVQVPSSSTDSVKLLLSDRAQFAILDIHDLAIAREQGRDIVGVMAIVQRPLAAILAQPAVKRPRDLEGKRVGVTGLPSDDAVLRSIVRGDGGDPTKVHEVTIGFQAVSALLSRRVDGATAFWNAEGVALSARRPGFHDFKVDDYGAPPYPELVLCVSRETLRDDRSLVADTVSALRRGYEEAIADPESATEALVDATHVDRAATARELDAVSPAFTEGVTRYGELDPSQLRAWAAWEARFGITKRPPDVARAFAPGF